MKLPWTTRRQERRDVQLDIARIADYLADTYDVLGDIATELRGLNDELDAARDDPPRPPAPELPPEDSAAIWHRHTFTGDVCPACHPRTPAQSPSAREVLSDIACQSAAAGKARGL